MQRLLKGSAATGHCCATHPHISGLTLQQYSPEPGVKIPVSGELFLFRPSRMGPVGTLSVQPHPCCWGQGIAKVLTSAVSEGTTQRRDICRDDRQTWINYLTLPNSARTGNIFGGKDVCILNSWNLPTYLRYLGLVLSMHVDVPCTGRSVLHVSRRALGLFELRRRFVSDELFGTRNICFIGDWKVHTHPQ